MNGSKGYPASDAPDSPERGDTVLSLKTVQRMLPLVQRSVTDILAKQQTLTRLQTEEELLDDSRRALAWPQRQRRYAVKDERARADHDLHAALDELKGLGLILLDPAAGRVGFPTMVNNRRAYFSWQAGEEGLHHWRFADEDANREIPGAWLREISRAGTV